MGRIKVKQAAGRRQRLLRAAEQGGKFEVDEAEPPVGEAVRDIAQERVVVADAVFLQFGEEASQLVRGLGAMDVERHR